MNMFNRLPYFVFIDNEKIKINADYRNMISFEQKIMDSNVKKSEKIDYGLKHFYPYFFYNKIITNIELYKEACEKLVWFYQCGRDDYHKSTKGSGKPTQIYSYDYDDEYIYGAFLEEYKIDLSTDFVHWWKFKALLKSLRSDCEFVKIKGYRAYDGKDDNMLELKKYYSLPLPQSEIDRQNKLYEMLK